MGAHGTLDVRFGEITVETLDAGALIRVSGDAIPEGAILRSGGRSRTDVPIGTRDGCRLHLAVGGAVYDMRPGLGGFSRRSHRVVVTGHGREWLFTPATPSAHRLVDGDRYRGGNEIGVFTADASGVNVEWSQEVRFAGVTATAVEPDPTACTVGYLLSAAFGTGARLMVAAVVGEAVGAMFPG